LQELREKFPMEMGMEIEIKDCQEKLLPSISMTQSLQD
jgi:hypothetical protein